MHYVFVTREEFEQRARAGGFLEFREYNGHLYGTPTLEPPPGRDVLLEIEVDGAQQVKARYPDAVIVLVVAPSPRIQEARLRARGDREGDIARRLAVSLEEERIGREIAAGLTREHRGQTDRDARLARR